MLQVGWEEDDSCKVYHLVRPHNSLAIFLSLNSGEAFVFNDIAHWFICHEHDLNPNGKAGLTWWSGSWFWCGHLGDPKVKTEHSKLLVELITPQEYACGPQVEKHHPEFHRGKKRGIAQWLCAWAREILSADQQKQPGKHPVGGRMWGWVSSHTCRHLLHIWGGGSLLQKAGRNPGQSNNIRYTVAFPLSFLETRAVNFPKKAEMSMVWKK